MYLGCPAKINLGLRIYPKQSDGYHPLESFFLPISLYDIVEIFPSTTSPSRLHLSGISIPGSPSDNLLLKLLAHLHLVYGWDTSWDIFLHKQIPVGSGLGGGSSDAMGLLRLLEHASGRHLSPEEKKETAKAMGSDCAFFLEGCPSFVTGRGECVEPVEPPAFLQAYELLLVLPNLHLSTPSVYKNFDEWLAEGRIPPLPACSPQMIYEPMSAWKTLFFNQLEMPVFAVYPILEKIKSLLYEVGASYAAMSGSGSALYGFFPIAEKINWERAYQILLRHTQNALSLSLLRVKVLAPSS